MISHPYWAPRGTVYGTLLNFRGEWALWQPRMDDKPYGGAPKAPVLYVKTANTFAPHGASVALPPGEAIEVAASLGLLIGDDGQPSHVLLVNDVSVAHDSYYRPAIKFRNRDGFLGLPLEPTPLSVLGGLDGLAGLEIELRIHGVHKQTTALRDLVRDMPTLLRDVAGFMTLRPGDVLLLGSECLADGSRPRVSDGDVVEISAAGLKPVVQRFEAEEVSA
ncbi:MAG: fumarylacetoacetate hydrolase family protein [Hydrogenophaga sp.]|uniref:fumarylacetoacetate hydrolase family protein n=1 Tax=Hydrogenophaga sp. TaxID=1904254 RepID=UPI001D75BC71|nr:fumarylacetoacetate hydrolase family protein [Hydrogenophaga sp.]MBX3611645.1 fumarylacetoacetate hydrolase family protein [Hydrogenophaga sp.]